MKKKVSVIGAAGYTGGELIRLLLGHPDVEIDSLVSRSQIGKPVGQVHTDLLHSDLVFQQESKEADVFFLAMGHGRSREWMETQEPSQDSLVIDLSNEYREERGGHSFIYGLTEYNKEQLVDSKRIANPGCFASCIQLGLMPLAAKGFLKGSIHVNAVTGSTGAGVKPSSTGHFSWRSGNLSAYKIFTHQHLGEIKETLNENQKMNFPIYFVPVRGCFTRGIHASIYTEYDGTLEEAKKLFKDYYSDSPFVHLSEGIPNIKSIVNTNHTHLYLEKHDNQLVIISVLDNLVKGASGQAIQNMNVSLGFEEMSGLNLKSNVF
jgi:N-acetyl-gamma-glutamyl-phosphate reductase